MRMELDRRIQNIGLTRSQGWPASLKEARRLLVNPDLHSVVLGAFADRLPLREQVAMASDAHACLDAAAAASRAGRLFVIDHATLIDDLNLLAAMPGRVIRTPFDVTPIFMPGFDGHCPLFILKRCAEGAVVDILTAFPSRNNEKFYWGVPGFVEGCEDVVQSYATALLAAIGARNLKPIRGPR